MRIDNRLSLAGPARWSTTGSCSPAPAVQGPEREAPAERPSTIYHLYQTDHGITVVRAQRARARQIAADRERARMLGVAPGAPVLQVRRIALTFGDKPVEYRISTINTASHDYVSLLAKR